MYKLFMVDSSVGVNVKSDGTYHEKGEVLGYKTDFDSLEDAQAEKDRLLKLIPWQTCAIYGADNDEPEYYFNELEHAEYLNDLDQIREYLSFPWYRRIFNEKPTSKYIKT